MQVLPAKVSSSIARQLHSTYRTISVEILLLNDFEQLISDTINTIVDIIPFPPLIKHTISTVKNSIVSVANSLWSLFF